MLAGENLSREADDEWIWLPDSSSNFSVKSAYADLNRRQTQISVNEKFNKVVRGLWKCSIPSKVKIFVWRLLLGRIQVRGELFKRGVINNTHELCCVFCFNVVESV